MNVLPFVLVLIAFFAALSSSLLSQSKGILLTQISYTSYMQAQRKLRKTLTANRYAKIQTPKQTNTFLKRPKVSCQNWRNQPAKRAMGRLNIYALLFDENPRSHLDETFFKLMDLLYQNLPIYQELKTSNQLPLFFNRWKNQTDLQKITYQNPLHQQLLYKMRKGCICYDLEKGSGYPPIADFICIEKTSALRPMPWRIASPTLLKAFFGLEFTSKILSAEKQKQLDQPGNQSTLSLDELTQLFDSHFIDSSIMDLLNPTSGKSSSKEVSGVDSEHLTKVKTVR